MLKKKYVSIIFSLFFFLLLINRTSLVASQVSGPAFTGNGLLARFVTIPVNSNVIDAWNYNEPFVTKEVKVYFKIAGLTTGGVYIPLYTGCFSNSEPRCDGGTYWRVSLAGYLYVESSDSYKFKMTCNNGCTLFIGDYRLIYEWWETSGNSNTYTSGDIFLTSGYYPIFIQNVRYGKPSSYPQGNNLTVTWTNSVVTDQIIPSTYLFFIDRTDPTQ